MAVRVGAAIVDVGGLGGSGARDDFSAACSGLAAGTGRAGAGAASVSNGAWFSGAWAGLGAPRNREVVSRMSLATG